MLVRLAVISATLAAVLLAPSGAARADNPVLVATVGIGDGFNISLKDASGTPVKHLDPGAYTIQVHDQSEIHDFHLIGPGRRIALRNANGTKLTLLSGTTKTVIAVNDRSRVDNFHLRGPGVNKVTGVRFRGRVTWRLTLRVGSYVYRSDRHPSLRGTFTVTASA